jgi:anti-sigma-K factor RskA
MSDQETNSVPPTNSPVDELRELLPAYALGTLTPDEHRRAEQLLDQYPEMLPELDSYLALAEGLLLNVEPVQPRPGLRTRLLDQLAAEEAASEAALTSGSRDQQHFAETSSSAPTASHLPSLKRSTTEAASTPATQITQTTKRAAPEVSSVSPTTRTNRPFIRMGWALAAACLALLLVTNVYWFTTTNNLQAERDALQRDRETLVENILSESVHQVALLPADAGDENRIATIAWNEETEQATLYGSQLPAIEADQVYQVWLIQGDQATSAAVFPPETRHSFDIFFADLAGVDAVALTVEPAGGSEAPTTQPFAIAHLG